MTMVETAKITTIFFDLDDTLYPSSSGLWPILGKRIEIYMHEKLHLPLEEIPALRRTLFHTYGTTLRGLQHTYKIDARDFLAFVHDVPLDQYIQPAPALREMIAGYRQRKIIFTNADSAHAGRVIRRLGLDGIFEQIIDILDISPYCKPMPEAFGIAMRLAGGPPPEECLLIDDNQANLKAAGELGFQTIRIGAPNPEDDQVHYIPELIGLPLVFPSNGKEKK
jgi:putative hydrolase of the HAD superfamily